MTTTSHSSDDAARAAETQEGEVQRRASLHREAQRLLADEAIEAKRRHFYREFYFALGGDPSAEDLERLIGCLRRARERSLGKSPVIPGSPDVRRAVARLAESSVG